MYNRNLDYLTLSEARHLVRMFEGSVDELPKTIKSDGREIFVSLTETGPALSVLKPTSGERND